ncbi:longitudinals lacking protein, isoforms H/M/V isoform X6 [Hyalella azteca]|uniref:Longitudinals lacking protein, isoforms H/M/V isoform X6 n=1 Tax=Hyalella azteca TaxID=294128 RepID=A0A979FLM4_HYAAZ|nr:longitudinals lacking protein, isoforms H/M/V isoform X6 [Hyalella azteca]
MNCGGLLSLKWNNHRAAFFNVLSNLREKECYTDVTLACDGKFYPVHKLILSTCSEYFEQMLEQTHCKHPVIVLKDIQNEDLESLLSYMYVGEVNVVQEKLSGLIKAAECLKIKGLAVPDEEPAEAKSTGVFREKRTNDNIVSSEAKRRRQDDCASSQKHSSSSEEESSKRKTSTQEESGRDKTSPSSSNKCTRNNDLVVVSKGSILPSGDSSDKEPSQPPDISHDTSKSDSNAQLSDDEIELKNEEIQEADDDAPKELNDIGEAVKQEPLELDAVYLTDSNSATDIHDILQDRKHLQQADDNQEFMNELLGQHQADDGHREGQEPALPSSYLCTQQQQQLTARSSDTAQLPSVSHLTTPMEYASAPDILAMPNFCTPETARKSDKHELEANNSKTPGKFSSSSDVLSFDLLDFLSLKQGTGYQCPLCELWCRDKTVFRIHYRVHSGEKPFPCFICAYRTSQKSNLNVHLKTHKDLIAHSTFRENKGPEQRFTSNRT